MAFHYEEIPPAPELSTYIDHFGKLTNSAGEATCTVLPDGEFDLILEVVGNNLVNITLFGLRTCQTDILVSAHRTLYGIAFKPLAIEYILKTSIASLKNSSQALPLTFWDFDQLTFTNLDHFARFASASMQAIIRHNPPTTAWKVAAFNRIFRSQGSIFIQELAEQVNWSSRQMNRYVTKWLGLSLEAYKNIIRCAASYKDLLSGELYPLDGYYDQSHFIKAIRKYTGKKPSQLAENDRILQCSTLFSR